MGGVPLGLVQVNDADVTAMLGTDKVNEPGAVLSAPSTTVIEPEVADPAAFDAITSKS